MNDKLIQKVKASGDLIYLEDGFLYFCPQTSGALSAEQLRSIADELDRRNKTWNKQLNEYFDSLGEK